MSDTIDLSGFVHRTQQGALDIDFVVEGITCAACIGRIEGTVAALPGRPAARLNYGSRRLRVSWPEGTRFDPAVVEPALRRIGYTIHPFDLGTLEDETSVRSRRLVRALAIAGFAAMNVMLLSVSVWAGDASGMDPATRDLFHWLSALIALPAALFAGQPFFSSAIAALRRRSLNMDVPISLGILLALGMSVVETARHAAHAYFDSALMLMFFLLAGRVLEDGMRRRTRQVATNLAGLHSPLARRLHADGHTTDVPVKTLAPGETVLVHPGDRVPVDGIVLSGESEIDDSLITGETRRRAVRARDHVYAGSLNFHGALRLQVEAAGQGTLLDEIERLLEGAAAARSRYVQLADRVARLYAPVVHVTALATATAWILAGAGLHDAIITAIAVLIITCPCALALAVPAVHVVTSGSLFREGLLINRGDALERAAGVDTVVFDKTGTLTLPEPRVINRDGIAPDLFAAAARLALSSRHPLARALAGEARDGIPFDAAEEIPGRGVRAVVDGEEARLGSPDFCAVAAGDEAEGLSRIAFRHGDREALFLFRQSLRQDAADTIARLQAEGLRLIVLSGDSEPAVAVVAHTLGIDMFEGSLKPADKVARLDALRAEGRTVLMVGDGLNDAPALAAANVSLSPATAADITRQTADVVFLGDRLGAVPILLAASRRARRLMQQNLALAVVYNLIAVPLAAGGWVTPLIAAAAMSGSSLLVTLNALRAQGRLGLHRRNAESASDVTASGQEAPVAGSLAVSL